jgi:hypothetical protein
VKHCFEVEFATAFLEEIFKGFTEQVHDHNVVHLAVVCLLVANEVKEGNKGFPPELVD